MLNNHARKSLITSILLGATLLVLSGQSSAAKKDDSVTNAELEHRLKKVERVLDNRVLLNMLQRIEAAMKEIREIRGEVERVDYEMRAMSKRQRDLYLDIDRRLQAIESGSESSSGIAGLSLKELNTLAETDDLKGEQAPDAAINEEAKTGELRKTEKPNEKQAYTKAYDTLMAGDHSSAVKAFSGFLDKYPLGPFSDNAWYWSGEASYVSRDFSQAVASFDKVIQAFPSSAKVPDAMLKKAFAYYEQSKFDEARQVLQKVVDTHPNTSAARLATKRLKAMTAEGN